VQFFYISIGAILGANLRYLVGLWAAQRLGAGFPYGTLLVNVIGCLIIGFFYGLGESRIAITPELRLFFAIGFLGAFTTFSTFGYETLSLLRSGELFMALLYFAGNNLLGLLAVFFGLTLAKLLS
jgi:CrcB protein